MRYSAKEEALEEEIYILTKWREQLFQSGKGSEQAALLLVDKLEKCIAELAVLRGLESGAVTNKEALKERLDGRE